ILGGKTQNEYEADIVVGNVAPSFRFASKSGVYMLLSGERGIELKTINLAKVNVRVSQIFQNNLVFFLDQGRSYDYNYEYYDEEEGGYGSYRRKFRYYVGNYGRMLMNDSIAVRNVTNQEVTTLFDLKPFMNTGYKGFYLVEIANPTEAWRSTSKLISVSDIGLIVKKSATEVAVFATSLETNEPIAGALVSVISTNNQVIASQKSDGEGVVRFGNFEDVRKGFTPKLITAELENDFNFINLADYRVETSRYDVDGKYDVANVYDAFMYGDRNIYRPGEKVHLSGIVRNLTHDLPAQLPVKLKVYNPQGTMVRETQHTLNEQGSFETSFQTASTSQTGGFRFELYTGNNLYLASYGVSVEDFVPDRLKVRLTASAEKAKPGDKIKYDLEALNF
ncbi:MAG: MG2 domain-containing protein, partial [Bacteroidota bacterium]